MTFLFVRAMIGAFAAGIGFVEEYLYNIMLPVLIVIAILLFWYVKHKHRSESKSD